MKFLALVTICLTCEIMLGCASDPKAEKPGPIAPAANQLPVAAVANGTLTKEKILSLQKEGYKLVDRDGQTYFCRTEKKTGSTIARDTVCMTEKEVDNLREVTQRRMGEITRQMPPPQGK